MESRKKQKKMLKHLVENAIDFLSKSISELRQSPKYSVINFHAAIELFLKARLMSEHWSLIISPKNEPDWLEFQQGKFNSVNLEEAAKRLEKAAQSGLSGKQISAFRSVSKHRNQMVHFFHQAETSEYDERRIRGIVKEQLKAWYFLHDLLLCQWQSVFEEWSTQISEIDVKLREHHEFLKVVFDELKPTITNQENKSYEFQECPSCGFNSEQHETELNEIYSSECLVCGLKENCIRVSCTKCDDGILLFYGESIANCQKCHKEHGGSTLLEVFIDETEAYLAAKDGDNDYPFPIHCGECCGYETVVKADENKYLCTECFVVTDSYGACEWCNGESTSLSDDTMWHGCEFCDGARHSLDND